MIAEYALAVIVAALICGVVLSLLPNGSAKELIRMLCGLFLAIVVLKPFTGLEFQSFSDYVASYQTAGERAALEGESISQQTKRNIIKTQAEAYILDKAAAMDLELCVDVAVSTGELPIPTSVTISGSSSPLTRSRLERMLEDDLGIPKEEQKWIG